MHKRTLPPFDVSDPVQEALIRGARDLQPVSGLTHNFYHYPGRFSPAFARAAIEAFTQPGDFVLDPFMGGGTSLVEAMALGRNAVGVDINQLAEFVTNVKTAVLAERELQHLTQWAVKLPGQIHIHRRSIQFEEYAEQGYYKHLDHPTRWRLRKAIEQALRSAQRLGASRMEAFARCVVLRTAQWALDGRKNLASVAEFREALSENVLEMIAAAREFRGAARSHRVLPKIRVLNRSAEGLEEDCRIISLPAPRLVITSPPYPGVHILYHRWQIGGGKETPLPFMIANKLDGAGSSYYTMGDRKYPELATYFDNITATMSSVVEVANDDTVFVQMVAFSDPEWQLPRYLEAMERVGLSEMLLPALKRERDGRLWRTVPGRRWYSDQRGDTPGSQEVVLIHLKQQAMTRRTQDMSAQLRLSG